MKSLKMELSSCIRHTAKAVLQTSLLFMKSLNETETPILLSVVCFFVSKGNLFDVYFIY